MRVFTNICSLVLVFSAASAIASEGSSSARTPVPGICDLFLGALPTMNQLFEMSEGAMPVFGILTKLESIDPGLIAALDDMNMRGKQIQIGLVDFSGNDIGVFAAAIRSRSIELVVTVNRLVPHGFPHMAVMNKMSAKLQR